MEDARRFVAQRSITTCRPLASRAPPEYGIKYIPHKVLVDKDGIVVQNFRVDWKTVDSLLDSC